MGKMIIKHSKYVIDFIFLCFISFCLISPLSAAEKNPQKKLQLLKKELLQINQDLKKTNKKKSQQVRKIQAFDVKIAKSRKQLKKFEAEKKTTKKEIKTLKAKSAILSKSIMANKKNLAEMTRALYQLGEENYLKIILNNSHSSEQSRMRVYYDYFYRSFEKQQQKLNHDLTEITAIDEALSQKLNEYDILLQTLENETNSLVAERKDKKAYLAKLNKKIKTKKTRLSTLKSSRKTLEKLLKALKKRKHREEMERLSGMSFAKHKGRLKWPVNGKVRRKYGQARANSGLKWRGVLISAKTGEKVRAVDAGMIVFADWLSGYGYVSIIDHGKGYMSLYGHNQQLLKDVGERVKVGDIIAEAGSSGRLGKPGLYFEIRRNGKPVNPAKWMMARKAR